MAGPSSVSGRLWDSKQAEEASSGSTHSTDPQDNSVPQSGLLLKLDCAGEDHTWTTVCPSGSITGTRYYHSAAVVGRKMLVVGGDSDRGMLNDVQQLHLGKLRWKVLAPLSKTKGGQQLPLCKGHSLVAWGQRLLLVTGETDPPMGSVSVWSFDMEKENWSKVEAKGQPPVVRSGHTVTRAGSVLILFGGEDGKGRKLNDLHMFDLKSSMWLPLLAMGSVPCPRSKHVAAIYDDRLLLVFGGASKAKYLNDLYALDFEAMEWSRLKTRGMVPGPRADCAGVLHNDKWYIAGGELNGTRYSETIMLDVARMTWNVVAHSNANSPSASQGFSMVLAQRKERYFLVAFGGKRSGIASEVEILLISAQERIQTNSPDGIIVEEPELPEVEVSSLPEDQSKHAGSEIAGNPSENVKGDVDIDTGQADITESKLFSTSEVKASYEKKLASAHRKNAVLEGQLKSAEASKENAERSLAAVVNSRQKAEKRLAVALKEIEDLKEKLAAAELAQEESINLTNIVHTENLRLDHDLAFLKAVLEDTQKELQTTRGVLSSERSRAFQLQVELFELKQTVQALQSNENPL